MPLFRATVEKFNGTVAEYWVNVYWLQAPNLDAALSAANAIATQELPILLSGQTLTKVRVDDNVKNTDQFLTTVRNANGTRASGASDALPLFATARVDLSTLQPGRPSRKFIRGCLLESDMGSYGTIVGAVLTLLGTFASNIANVPELVDVDNSDIVSGTVWPYVQQRQLRRGSKKKIVP